MEEKITITAEVGKNEVAGMCYLLGVELTDKIWKQLSDEPIKVDFNKMGGKDEQKLVKSMLISAAIISSDVQE